MAEFTDPYIAEKQAAHLRRYEAGKLLVELLSRRQHDEIQYIGFDRDDEIHTVRLKVWRAEYEAFSLDPRRTYDPYPGDGLPLED